MIHIQCNVKQSNSELIHQVKAHISLDSVFSVGQMEIGAIVIVTIVTHAKIISCNLILPLG